MLIGLHKIDRDPATNQMYCLRRFDSHGCDCQVNNCLPKKLTLKQIMSLLATSVWLKTGTIQKKYSEDFLKVDDDRFATIAYPDENAMEIFNIRGNSCEKVIKFKHPSDGEWDSTYAFDNDTQKLYIHNGQNNDYKLYEVDLNSKELKLLQQDINTGSFPAIIPIKDEIHVVGGDYETHFIYNVKQGTTREIGEFHDVNNCYTPISIHLKSEGRILTLNENGFCEFSLNTQKWNRLDSLEAIPEIHYCTHMLPTFDDEYVIVMGGYSDDKDEFRDDIFIIDTKKYERKKCSIKIPYQGRFHAMMMRNCARDDLLAFGYINKCFKSKELKDIQRLPHYLVKFIGNWFVMEFIHLFGIKDQKRFIQNEYNHWMINVDKLISCFKG